MNDQIPNSISQNDSEDLNLKKNKKIDLDDIKSQSLLKRNYDKILKDEQKSKLKNSENKKSKKISKLNDSVYSDDEEYKKRNNIVDEEANNKPKTRKKKEKAEVVQKEKRPKPLPQDQVQHRKHQDGDLIKQSNFRNNLEEFWDNHYEALVQNNMDEEDEVKVKLNQFHNKYKDIIFQVNKKADNHQDAQLNVTMKEFKNRKDQTNQFKELKELKNATELDFGNMTKVEKGNQLADDDKASSSAHHLPREVEEQELESVDTPSNKSKSANKQSNDNDKVVDELIN